MSIKYGLDALWKISPLKNTGKPWHKPKKLAKNTAFPIYYG